jgi:hypothetical protein
VSVTEAFPVSAGQLKPGDFVAEYGGLTVAHVHESERRASVYEVTFQGDPLTRFLHATEVLHVRRPVAAEAAAEDEDPGDEAAGHGYLLNLRAMAAAEAAGTFDTEDRAW